MDRERRKQYPANWEAISRQFRERKNFTCEHCFVVQGSRRISRWTGGEYTVVVAAAHVRKHDTKNEQPELLCLCPSCHWAYDHLRQEREEIIEHEKQKHEIVLSRRLAGRQI